MSPEQAKGGAVDRRADIWAFGVVLYEMLTGRRLIEGDSMPEVLGALFRQEISFDGLPAGTPPGVRRLLVRCLSRDPQRRLRDIGDARLELELADDEPAVAAATSRATPRLLPVSALVLLAALVGVAGGWFARGTDPEREEITRFAMQDTGVLIDAFFGLALSPDGRKLAYRARAGEDSELLHVRSFDTFEAVGLPGTELGWLPFFSPDGQRIAFMSGGGIHAVTVAGGSPRPVALFDGGFSGGTWLPDDTVVFAKVAQRRLFRAPVAGGPIETVEIEGSREGDVVSSPSGLPGGDAVLCNWGDGSTFDVALIDLETGALQILAENGFTPVYVDTGHILYREGVDGPVMALPFDVERREVTGAAFPVIDDLARRISFQVRMFAVGGRTLAYIPRSALADVGGLIWVDRSGEVTPVVEVDGVLDMPQLSHDNTRVAFRAPAPRCDVWVHDLERGATTRVTVEGDNHGTVWSSDDRSIVVARNETPDWGVLAIAADGAGGETRLSPSGIPRAMTSSASRDGRWVLISSEGEATGSDILLLDTSDASIRPLFASRFEEQAGALAPDGRMVAYTTNESERTEVYVQTFPDLGHRQQVSVRGGSEPVWSDAGDTLFFRQGRKIHGVAVRLRGDGTIAVGAPDLLFEGPATPVSGFNLPSYDVSADGERFLMIRQRSDERGAAIHVVENWWDELERLAAVEATGR
jgi:serine/threonine-protein kinase